MPLGGTVSCHLRGVSTSQGGDHQGARPRRLTSPKTHTSLAFVICLLRSRLGRRRKREFRRAIELNPNYANGHHWYARVLSLVGRHAEAIAESQRARELDPLSNIINAWVSSRYFFARRYDKAIKEGRNAVEVDPDFAPAHLVLGDAYEQKGMLKEAVTEFEDCFQAGRGIDVLSFARPRLGRRGKKV